MCGASRAVDAPRGGGGGFVSRARRRRRRRRPAFPCPGLRSQRGTMQESQPWRRQAERGVEGGSTRRPSAAGASDGRFAAHQAGNARATRTPRRAGSAAARASFSRGKGTGEEEEEEEEGLRGGTDVALHCGELLFEELCLVLGPGLAGVVKIVRSTEVAFVYIFISLFETKLLSSDP